MRKIQFFLWIGVFGLTSLSSLSSLSTSPALAFDPAAGDFDREDSGHIRLMTWNVLINFIREPATDDEFARILTTIDPDIICLQEVSSTVSEFEIRTRLESLFPGDTWSVHQGAEGGGIRVVVASRYNLSLQRSDTVPASDVRGVVSALVDLPGETDLYVMGAHFKSGSSFDDHRRRQVHADAIINWIRDAQNPGGSITLEAGTPMVITGDFNIGFLGGGDEPPYRASRTLIDGNIFHERDYGSDFLPDWDRTVLTDAVPHDPITGDPDTFSSAFTDPASRFDRIIYTDSVLRVANRFILNTATLPPAARNAAGLQANDTETAADHLPAVVDFRLAPEPAPGELVLNEFLYDNPGSDNVTFLEIRNVGGRPVNLDAPLDFHVLRSTNSLPTTPPGSENETADFDLAGVIPPGGLFVLYDAGGDSSALASQIATRLPPLQRQSLSGFSLNNGPEAGIALVTLTPLDTSRYTETLVDGYLYEDASADVANYFLTNSDNNLLIEYQADQSFLDSLTSATESFARRRGSNSPNDVTQWEVPAPSTPGEQNGGVTGPLLIAY